MSTTRVDGTITPVISQHLRDAVSSAADAGHEALLVELDTPGGLVTSMREIVQRFLNAPIPVIVYVSPSGADAGSAGTFITLSAHVAAMAPATTIGAATPVGAQGGEVSDKIINNLAAAAEAVAKARDRDVEFAVDAVREGRSITAGEAADIGAIDLVVDSVPALLAEVDGREVEIDSGAVTLDTADAELVSFEMSWVRELLQLVADPNLAFIFLSIGSLAILYEVANPGIGAGGVIGVISIVLAMFSLSVLPVNWAGLVLVVLGVGLVIAEAVTPTFGVAGVGGSISLMLGGLFLFQRPTGIGVDLVVLLPTGIVVLVLSLVAGRLVAKTRHQPSRAASDALIGRTSVVEGGGDRAVARFDGIRWRLRPEPGTSLTDGDTVVVVDRDNLDLIVRPATEDGPPTPSAAADTIEATTPNADARDPEPDPRSNP